MKRKPFDTPSQLAFRLALTSALLIAAPAAAAVYFIVNPGLNPTLLISGLVVIGSFAIIYLVAYRLQFSRLKALNRINQNIARKRFEDYNELQNGGKDELDYLIKQSVRASKTVEREIQRLNRIENYRKEFIGDISHELKTPIFAVQGFIETLLDGAIEDERVNRQFLQKAMRNVNRLIYLTKDLMEISKLETGELKSNMQNMDIRRVTLDVVENLQYKADKENIFLTIDQLPAYVVFADRNQIKQVLINLIENAIKYNRPEGRVTVGAKQYLRDQNKILVHVRDTGIGISEQFIERVTERFFRVDKSRSREKGGTGLGLAIVKHIMEAHGEEFFIDSDPDQGSTFSFTLTKGSSAPPA